MPRLEFGFKTVVLGLLLAAFVGAYQPSFFTSQQEDPVRESQAAELARKLTLELPVLSERPQMIVVPFRGDNLRILDPKLREWLAQRNVQIVPPTVWERARDLWGTTGTDHRNPAKLIEAFREQYPQGYILWGEVLDWVTYPASKARLTATIHLLSLESGKTIYQETLTLNDHASDQLVWPTYSENAPRTRSTWTWRELMWGFTFWMWGVFLSPWILSGAISVLLKKDSNWVNGVLLALLVLLSTLAAWLCWTRGLSGDLSVMGTLFAGGTSIPYLGYCCGRLNTSRV